MLYVQRRRILYITRFAISDDFKTLHFKMKFDTG